MQLAPGSLVDRYTVASVLGQGGMAIVYKVRHNTLGSLHALKVLTVSTPGLRDRLKIEGQVQANLRHPNIAAVTDVIDVGGAPGLVMEFVDGPDLDGLLRAQRLTFEQADALARDILGGVGAAHAKGLIHRDLKPANILLQVHDDRLVPKVTDFGLAKAVNVEGGGARTRTGAVMGTPHYMSPEQVRDAKHVGPTADIFALGAILYEMVAGRRAFDGADLYEIFTAVAEGRYKPVRELVPDLPDRMERAIVEALRTDAAARVQDCKTLLAIWNGEIVADGVPSVVRTGPWDAAVLDRARAISAGGDDPEPGRSDPTFAASGASIEHDAKAPARSASKSMSPGGVVTMGLLVGGGGAAVALAAVLAVVAIVAALAWAATARPGVARPAPADVAPIEAPAPTAPTPAAPAPAEPAPAEPGERPSPADPGPAPADPRPAPADPRPTPEPAPAQPGPAPAPAPSPAPAPAPTGGLPPDLDPKVTSKANSREEALIDRYKGRPDATGIIAQVLRTDPSMDVQVVAANVLRDRWRAGTDPRGHQQAMTTCARSAKAQDARVVCLTALGAFGDASAGAVLGEVSASGAGDVRKAAQDGCRKWLPRHPGARCG